MKGQNYSAAAGRLSGAGGISARAQPKTYIPARLDMESFATTPGTLARRTLNKILEIRMYDHYSLLPLTGRKVYLTEEEFDSIKADLVPDKPPRLLGYDIIREKDLK